MSGVCSFLFQRKQYLCSRFTFFKRYFFCVCGLREGKKVCVFVRKDQMLTHGVEGEFLYLPGDY